MHCVLFGFFYSENMNLPFSAPQGLTANDPRWIGAWRLGYVIVAAALFLPALLLFSYSIDQLESANDLAKRRQSTSSQVKRVERKEQNGLVHSATSNDTKTSKKRFSVVNEALGNTFYQHMAT